MSSLTIDKVKAPTGIIWNDAHKSYEYPNGATVSDAVLSHLLSLHQIEAQKEVVQIGRNLLDKKITLLQWQLQTREALKELHLANMLLARGGRKNVSPQDYLRVGRRLKNEYKYLRDFAKDINRGYSVGSDGSHILLTRSRFFNRLKMYINSSEISYNEAVKQNYIDMGYKYAERHLNSKVPCKDCPGYAALGVVSIRDLILPQTECECLSNCKCTIQYYRTKPR